MCAAGNGVGKRSREARMVRGGRTGAYRSPVGCVNAKCREPLARTMGGLFPNANNKQAWARDAREGYFFLFAAIRDTGFFAYFTTEDPTVAFFGYATVDLGVGINSTFSRRPTAWAALASVPRV